MLAPSRASFAAGVEERLRRLRRGGDGGVMALSLGLRDRGNVVAAHPVFADVGDEGEVEFPAHHAAEKAAHRLRRPAGLGDYVVDGDAGLSSQHVDNKVLFWSARGQIAV